MEEAMETKIITIKSDKIEDELLTLPVKLLYEGEVVAFSH